MRIDPNKEALRNRIWDKLAGAGIAKDPYGRTPEFEGRNRAAERLKRWPVYREARRLMVTPDEALLQVRLNALGDRKRLITASPGLKEGFFELDAKNIKVKDRVRAAKAGGISVFGRKLSTDEADLGRIDLLVTGAVAADRNGGRLGKGKGFFDLEYAILRVLGCIDKNTLVVAVVHEEQIVESVPMEKGDVPVDRIVTPDEIVSCRGGIEKPAGLPENRITERDIKRIGPLYRLLGLHSSFS